MRRREFLIGAAASAAAASPALAEAPKLSGRDMWPPLNDKALRRLGLREPRRGPDTISSAASTAISKCSPSTISGRRADKRAFLLTPREEFVLPEDRDQAYVGHYLDIGFGVTITPPGTMGRMTSALGVKPGEQGARDRHRLRLPVGAADLSDQPRSIRSRSSPSSRSAPAASTTG